MTGMKDQTQKVPPDAEIIARQWALSQTIITDIVGTNIATRLPRGSALPFLVLFTEVIIKHELGLVKYFIDNLF